VKRHGQNTFNEWRISKKAVRQATRLAPQTEVALAFGRAGAFQGSV
jgi:hypothetical protein